MTALEQLTLDPTSEDPANVPLDLIGGAYAVTSFSTPTPALDPRWAQPADADGDRLVAARYLNREIGVVLTLDPPVAGTAAVDVQAALAALAAKLAKINREGGTLLRTLPSGDPIVFDLLTAEAIDPPWNGDWDAASVLQLELRFTARPFARGQQQVRGVHAASAIPALVFAESGIPGDVPALGRLVVTEGAGADQAWCVWGAQAETYDPASTAALFYEAESRTPLGSAAVATVSGASGGASRNVVTETWLSAFWTGVLSTRAVGGGAHLTHVGDYRVLARILRPSTNDSAATVSLRLEWALGDFGGFARNASLQYAGDELADVFTIADLGIVSIPAGTSHWEGRIVAVSTTAGDDLTIDALWLVPTERSGEVTRVLQQATVASLTGFDTFDYATGVALAGCRTVPGGTWSGGGDADDFTIDTTNHAAKRVATGDGYVTGPVGRWAVLPPVKTDTAVQADVRFSAVPVDANATEMGVIARFVNGSNYLIANLDPTGVTGGGLSAFRVSVRVGGYTFYLGAKYLSPQLAPGGWYTIRVEVDARGNWRGYFGPQGALPTLPTISGQSSLLATGGTLASGADGIWEWWFSSTASTREYDNFSAWVPTPDAALFASQSLALSYDGVTREDAAGTLWTPVSSYEGDLLTVPPSGAEGRVARFLVKASRDVPGVGADTAIDAISAQLTLTPRYLVVP